MRRRRRRTGSGPAFDPTASQMPSPSSGDPGVESALAEPVAASSSPDDNCVLLQPIDPIVERGDDREEMPVLLTHAPRQRAS